jgi:hypothetical protein
MDHVVRLDRQQAKHLLDNIDLFRAEFGDPVQMSFAIENDKLMVKFNAGVWSAPMGGPL